MKPPIFLSTSKTCSPTNPKAYTYGFKPVMINGPNDLEQVVATSSYSSFFFKDGHRKADNLQAAGNVLIYDFDSKTDIAEIMGLTEGYRVSVATTRSHTEDHPKFRLFMMMDRHLQLSEVIPHYRNIYRYVGENFGFASWIDHSCIELARQFAPTMGGTPLQFFYEDGELLNVDRLLEYSSELKERERKQNLSQKHGSKRCSEHLRSNELPTSTLFQTEHGVLSFLELESMLKRNVKIKSRCRHGLDHGSLWPAFISKTNEGSVFYHCMGNKCQHEGTLWLNSSIN